MESAKAEVGRGPGWTCQVRTGSGGGGRSTKDHRGGASAQHPGEVREREIVAE